MRLICIDDENRDNFALRTSFNALTRSVFGFDFEEWYQNGWWSENYLPYCLLDGEKVVANVSVNRMELLQNGTQLHAVQLGTVMTAPEYRGRGLLRQVMEAVLNEWKNKTDFIYLFANDTVLDFYPKFSFRRVREHKCFVSPLEQADAGIRKLDTTRVEDRKTLLRLAWEHVPVSPVLSMERNAGLFLFYGLGFLKDSLYYRPERDMLAVLIDDGRTIADILSEKPFDLAEAVSMFAQGRKEIALGFAPGSDFALPTRYEPLGDDDSLFMMPVSGDFTKTMFPILSHA